MIGRIEYFHNKNFIHRDIKPDNFLMGISKSCNKVNDIISLALYMYYFPKTLKCSSSKFLFSHMILYSMQWTLAKQIFNLDKKRFFMRFSKPENPILLQSTRAADQIIDMLRFVM